MKLKTLSRSLILSYLFTSIVRLGGFSLFPTTHMTNTRASRGLGCVYWLPAKEKRPAPRFWRSGVCRTGSVKKVALLSCYAYPSLYPRRQPHRVRMGLRARRVAPPGGRGRCEPPHRQTPKSGRCPAPSPQLLKERNINATTMFGDAF